MISVIIVNYHSALMTKQAVESVFHDDEDIEIYVVDNTATIEERQALTLLLPDKVHLVFNESNEGFARACNRAYDKSLGQYILLLNPDAYFLPGSVRALREFLDHNPLAGAAGPRIYWDDERTFLLPPSILPTAMQELRSQVGHLWHFFSYVNTMLYRRQCLRVWQVSAPVRQNALSGGHMMLRRTSLEQCGGLFDNRFFMYFEDSDLMLRLQKAGFHIFVEPRAEVVHNYIHENNKSTLMSQTKIHYFQKNFSGSLLLKLAGKLSRASSRSLPGPYKKAGTSRSPITFHIPAELQKHWLFEWSPSFGLIPSVGHFGSGSAMVFPARAWDLLGPGTYYARVSSPKNFALSSALWFWEKE